jgi:hypothetical protein
MSIQDDLFKSIEILFEKYLEKQQLSRTVASTVMDVSGDKYQCNIDGASYMLKNGSGVTLTVGTAVWVHIPQNKINNAFIMGTR